MDNKNQSIKCSGKDCDKIISQEQDEYGLSYIKLGPLPINEQEKCEKILFALLKTRVFCGHCCDNYVTLICDNSKIDVN